jgi:hypothetical protein
MKKKEKTKEKTVKLKYKNKFYDLEMDRLKKNNPEKISTLKKTRI